MVFHLIFLLVMSVYDREKVYLHSCFLEKELFLYLKMFILFYADDTVILAESANDLQFALNEFYRYCDTWKLTFGTSGDSGIWELYVDWDADVSAICMTWTLRFFWSGTVGLDTFKKEISSASETLKNGNSMAVSCRAMNMDYQRIFETFLQNIITPQIEIQEFSLLVYKMLEQFEKEADSPGVNSCKTFIENAFLLTGGFATYPCLRLEVLLRIHVSPEWIPHTSIVGIPIVKRSGSGSQVTTEFRGSVQIDRRLLIFADSQKIAVNKLIPCKKMRQFDELIHPYNVAYVIVRLTSKTYQYA
eukprot:XP_019930688.1 PREDICTED: uncharacterized protein LOC109621142 [Crassostrea gigas]